MENVQNFKNELQSILDNRPPVTKAKMGLVTRAAMKCVKFYKHVVMSVEKFIAKSRPEYKIPGLYVIDSIVRQSIYQFGPERDVFRARFARNFPNTFENLFSGCLPEDKPRIVRVLNLWLKNGVFTLEVIQPLHDLAIAKGSSSNQFTNESNHLSAESPQGNIDQAGKSGSASRYNQHQNQFEQTDEQLYVRSTSSSTSKNNTDPMKFNKSMLDFDYDEDDDDGDETPTEAEPPLSSTLSKIEMEQRNASDTTSKQITQTSLQAHELSQLGLDTTNMNRTEQDAVLERWNKLFPQQSMAGDALIDGEKKRSNRSRSKSPQDTKIDNISKLLQHQMAPQPPSPPPPPPRSPEKLDPKRESEREAERIAERALRCLPEIKDKHLTVCSSTLWLGHVPKTVSESDLSDFFGIFGPITSIDLIPPRGCAYVCMDRRQDAKKALSKSRDLRLNGSHIKMAWAPGKGFKEYKKLKDFWRGDLGCSYIPYSKIDSSIDFDVLEEGGVIDEDSMSMDMRETRERKLREKEGEKSMSQHAPHPSMMAPPPVMGLPIPILTQPPPFAIPPPTNLSIPPPNVLAQAQALVGHPMMPFPPPNMFDGHLDQRQKDGLGSPSTIEQQLNMTEQQISQIEQQLNIIQQSSHNPSVPPGAMFNPANAANSMHLFDMTQPPPLDPQMFIGGGMGSFIDPALLQANLRSMPPSFGGPAGGGYQ